MKTIDLIDALREDIRRDLLNEIKKELIPWIEQRLYNNTFDINEAAMYLKRSVSAIRTAVKKKDVPHFRQGGQLYFRQQDLDKWINEKVNLSTIKDKSKNYSMSVDQLPDILTVKQIAELQGWHPNTVYMRCTSGEIKSFKSGNSRRIRKTAYLEWIEKT